MSDATDERDRRTTLDRDTILDGAVTLADAIGVEALTIRKLADHLGTKPMSLYHHVANKDAILDGMVDRVFAEIEPPALDLPWQEAIRRRMHSGREVLARHSWAPAILETRTEPGAATLDHHEAMLACLFAAGFSTPLVAHAYAVLDSFLYGFAMQEATLPFADGAPPADLVGSILDAIPDDRYPSLRRLTAEHVVQPGYSFGSSFDVGLELLLDGLAAAHAAERG